MLISMRLVVLVFLMLSFKCIGQIPTYDWSVAIGGTSNDIIRNTSIDNAGNVYNSIYFHTFILTKDDPKFINFNIKVK